MMIGGIYPPFPLHRERFMRLGPLEQNGITTGKDEVLCANQTGIGVPAPDPIIELIQIGELSLGLIMLGVGMDREE